MNGISGCRLTTRGFVISEDTVQLAAHIDQQRARLSDLARGSRVHDLPQRDPNLFEEVTHF